MIKIFQHRVNDIRTIPVSDYAEIDVQIDSHGRALAFHDPDEAYPVVIPSILHKWKGFIVDIKQNMPLRYFDQIAEIFGDKLEGFIDVPYPCLHEVRRKYKVFERYSEHEILVGDLQYIDPLESWSVDTYKEMLEEVSYFGSPMYSTETILAAPDLHGVAVLDSLQVIGALVKEYPQIYGVITKHPVEMAKLCCV